ncbi:MerR family transcriptional regulator [Aeromonas hydrophila]|uniref:MerR family transcriptional regulator n=1 Tax=Aeromonas hydrophila TaxID=644 RepID=UPI000332AAB3|nr:MerR family transcriptional regulator [Aeromonas hydrophila]AGM42961.1 MerR family transcriptional regulator [Aeromonas hydrophila ML09-119]AHX31660.1 MerR family transcriptional regulator [Aeromonas hydrophila subsp. hydrophila AL09-71]AHX68457.1 MerR family transcriptional regulator [Aeromonas hydrophila pc104A]AKJ35776.1 MerR family transcriptional regulator [Aeromonas hydrophila NJ-35]ALQ64601.1 helix-turn-helix-type transcriptional regulator [Aeromonas hydrophila]
MSDLPHAASSSPEEGIYPIREVSRLTGVNAVTLRAWQRRYGLVQPARTEKGHRLYSEQDIRQIGEILSWLERGVSIGQVKGLLSEPQAQPVSDHWQQTLEQFSQALLAFNQRKAEAELNDLLASYPFELVRSRVLQPLVERLLGLWRERPDGELLQQVWLGWLHTRFARHLIEQEKGMPATLASWGQVGPLDLVWAAYELIGQGHEVQLLGAVEPRHASLLEGRAVTPWLVLLGAGLGKQELAAVWPAGTRFFGELGRLYDGEWLQAHGWQASLAELMVDAPAAAGAGGRGRKKS